MSEKSTEPEAPEPGDTAVDEAAVAEQPAAPAYGPPPPGWRPPRKKLTEQSFTWKGLLVAAVVGFVVGGGIVSGVAAIVDHHDHEYTIKIKPGHGYGKRFGGGQGFGGGQRLPGQRQQMPGQQPSQQPGQQQPGAPGATPSQGATS